MEKRQNFVHPAAIDGILPQKTSKLTIIELLEELNFRLKNTQTKKVRARILILKAALERKNLNSVVFLKNGASNQGITK